MRKALLLSVLTLFTFTLHAKKINGRIFFENDTIDVTLNIPFKLFSKEPNYQRLQNRLKYYDSTGAKVVVTPDQVKEFAFSYGYEVVRMLSRENSLGLGGIFAIDTNIFLKLEVDGALKLFKYYFTQSSPGMYNASTGMVTGAYSFSVENYVLQKGDEELMRPRGLTFRKDMTEYFDNCPDLAEKIDKKEFRRADITAIVNFYNSMCGRDK